MVFFSHRTKRESPAGDQFWKFSHQCSIFGRIGEQWVAISSPDLHVPVVCYIKAKKKYCTWVLSCLDFKLLRTTTTMTAAAATYVSNLFVLLFLPLWLGFAAIHEKLFHSNVKIIYPIWKAKKFKTSTSAVLVPDQCIFITVSGDISILTPCQRNRSCQWS